VKSQEFGEGKVALPEFNTLPTCHEVASTAIQPRDDTTMKAAAALLLSQAFIGTTQAQFINELVYLEGHRVHEDFSSPLPHT
jgi:hypothetical protein